MKKIIFLAVFVGFICINAFCQDSIKPKYEFVIGGSLGFSVKDFRDYYEYKEKSYSYFIMPVIGVILNDKLSAGLQVEFSNSSIVQNDIFSGEFILEEKVLSTAVFARIDFNITDKFKFYLEPNLGRKFYLNSEEQKKIRLWFVNTNVGVLYFISDNFSLEMKVAGMEYEHLKIKGRDLKLQTFNLTYDIVKPNIGLKFYF